MRTLFRVSKGKAMIFFEDLDEYKSVFLVAPMTIIGRD